MKNIGKILVILVMATSGTTKLYAGDPIIGCPLGVKKGKLWIFTKTIHMKASETLWSEDPDEQPTMVKLPAGWYARISNMTIRLNLGISDRLTVGLVSIYIDKNIKREIWITTPNGTKVRKWQEINSHGFSDLWITGLYKIINDHPTFEALSVGAALRLDIADDPLVLKGIGSGAKAFRIAILSHIKLLENLSGVTNVWFQKNGKIRKIFVKNDSCQIIEWSKSGRKLGDSYGFKLGVEKSVSSHLVGVASLVGTWHSPDEDYNGKTVESTKSKEVSLLTMIHYLPIDLEHEHSKFGFGIKTTLSVRKNFSARFIPVIMAMWTF